MTHGKTLQRSLAGQSVKWDGQLLHLSVPRLLCREGSCLPIWRVTRATQHSQRIPGRRETQARFGFPPWVLLNRVAS